APRRAGPPGGRRWRAGSSGAIRGGGGWRRSGGGLHLRDNRPGGLPVGKPEPRPGRGGEGRGVVTYSNARVKLTYPENLIREPIIARMVREFGVMPNIRRANVEEKVGWIVCEIGGDDDAVERAIVWLQRLGVEVDRLGGDVVES